MADYNNQRKYSNPEDEYQEKQRKMKIFFKYYADLVEQDFNGFIEVSLKHGLTGDYPHEKRVRNLHSWKKRNNMRKQGIVESSEGGLVNDSLKLEQLQNIKGNIDGDKGLPRKVNCK